jgi:hypothetical protein
MFTAGAIYRLREIALGWSRSRGRSVFPPVRLATVGGEEAGSPGESVVACGGEVEMNEEQARRLASNEALFRKVNERMVGLNEAFEPLADSSVFVCECDRIQCVEQIEMTLDDYKVVRSNPRWFVVAPSEEHVVAEIERVVERTAGYFVVEKVEAAAEVAEQLDRR